MRRHSKREVELALTLDGPGRYEYFIRSAVSAKCVWGLWDDGWALLGDSDETPVLPLWPGREFAERCRSGVWESYKPKRLELLELVQDMVPRMSEQGVLFGVFPTPQLKGVVVSTMDFKRSLLAGLERFA